MPTEVNLRTQYRSFGELEAACRSFCEEVNSTVHRVTGQVPAEMLIEERTRLHRLPDEPSASAFGLCRRVVWDSTISMDGLRYSVPHQLIDSRVWARWSGDTLIITAIDEHGPREVARHPRVSKANPAAGINDAYYPPRETDPLHREPRARSAEEAAFLAIGPGAVHWLTEAAAAGATRVRSKIAAAVTLTKLYGGELVDQALASAAAAGRVAEGDLPRSSAINDTAGVACRCGPAKCTRCSRAPRPGPDSVGTVTSEPHNLASGGDRSGHRSV